MKARTACHCSRTTSHPTSWGEAALPAGADIIAIALGSVAIDPEVAAWIAEGDGRRRAGQAHLVADWHAAGALRPDVSQSEAADVLYTLTSPEVFLLLVKRLGWDPDRYEHWVTDTVSALLLHA